MHGLHFAGGHSLKVLFGKCVRDASFAPQTLFQDRSINSTFTKQKIAKVVSPMRVFTVLGLKPLAPSLWSSVRSYGLACEKRSFNLQLIVLTDVT
jgi:hypothetical protein